MKDDKYYIKKAIALAIEGMRKNEGGPFGAVVVKDGKIVGQGWNRVTSTNDPTAHAEVTAIRDACSNLGSFQLEGCTVYSSCEPCPMCLGAIYWARPERLVFAAAHYDAADIASFDDQFIYEELSKKVEERAIPTDQILQKEGLEPFLEWQKKQDKQAY